MERNNCTIDPGDQNTNNVGQHSNNKTNVGQPPTKFALMLGISQKVVKKAQKTSGDSLESTGMCGFNQSLEVIMPLD